MNQFVRRGEFRTCALLRFYKSRSTVDADNQATSDFRVKRSTVTRFFDTQDASQPGDDFV